jgi:outer membrane protein assembly factor BamB
MSRLAPALLGLLALHLGGCSYIPWLAGEKDPRPPTELAPVATEQALTPLWTIGTGKGTDGRRLSLEPAHQKGQLFVADARGLVTAISAADGRILWQRDTGLPLSGGPDVAGDRLVVGSTNGDLLALAIADGGELWRAQVGSEILSVPRFAGDQVVLHTLNDSVFGFNAATGEQLWNYDFQAPVLTLRGSSTPLILNDYALVGVSGGRLAKIELASGLPEWITTVTPPRGRSELERIADLNATPVVMGQTVYVATYNGDLAALDLVSGAVLWRRALSSYAGLTLADGTLYVTDADDIVWAAKPEDGTGLWKQEALRYRILSAPTVVGNTVLVGDLEGYIHLLARGDGRLLGRARLAKGAIQAQPLVLGGQVIVLGADGTLSASILGTGTTIPASSPPAAPPAAPSTTPTKVATPKP